MKTYRETMDELRFTEQEKEAMVDRLLERGGSSRKGLNLRCAAVAVAAAARRTCSCPNRCSTSALPSCARSLALWESEL